MNGMLMNGMIVPLSTSTDVLNGRLEIGNTTYWMKASPDGASLIQATITHAFTTTGGVMLLERQYFIAGSITQYFGGDK